MSRWWYEQEQGLVWAAVEWAVEEDVCQKPHRTHALYSKAILIGGWGGVRKKGEAAAVALAAIEWARSNSPSEKRLREARLRLLALEFEASGPKPNRYKSKRSADAATRMKVLWYMWKAVHPWM